MLLYEILPNDRDLCCRKAEETSIFSLQSIEDISLSAMSFQTKLERATVVI